MNHRMIGMNKYLLVVPAFTLLIIGSKFAPGNLDWYKASFIGNEHLTTARVLLLNSLKDPDSVQWRNEKVASDNVTMCGEINAKNSLGGYVGFRQFISNHKGYIVEGSNYGTWSMQDNRIPVPDYMIDGARLVGAGKAAHISQDVWNWFWKANCA